MVVDARQSPSRAERTTHPRRMTVALLPGPPDEPQSSNGLVPDRGRRGAWFGENARREPCVTAGPRNPVTAGYLDARDHRRTNRSAAPARRSRPAAMADQRHHTDYQ